MDSEEPMTDEEAQKIIDEFVMPTKEQIELSVMDRQKAMMVAILFGYGWHPDVPCIELESNGRKIIEHVEAWMAQKRAEYKAKKEATNAKV